MNLRDALMNLAITAVLVLVIALVALVLHRNRPALPKAIPVPGQEPLATTYEQDIHPVRQTFEVLDKVSLVDSRGNEADTLRINTGTREEIFVLYFVDALEASWNHPQRINDQARWFGNVTDKAIVDGGVEALNYVRNLLTTRPFTVLTRWERIPNSTRYYALIMVEHQPGQWVYLADLLMNQGYARIHGLRTALPNDSRDEITYLLELKTLGQQARTAKAGIWAKAAP